MATTNGDADHEPVVARVLSYEGKNIYNANDLLDSSEDEETTLPGPDKPQDVLALLRKWLELDSPELSEKMVDFLLQDTCLETMLDQIILVDKKIKLPASYKPGQELPYRARDYSNPLVIKRSYNAMELLAGNAKSLARLLQPKFRTIVNKLFEVFEYNSNGNFHHFRKLFESMLRYKPIEVLDMILLPRDEKPPLALSMLEFLDESPVSASLGTILFFPLRLTVVESERKKKLAHFLKTYTFIKRIVLRMGYSDTSALAASDFLFRIIDECTRVESSDVITSCMEDPDDSMVDWIFSVLLSRGANMRNAQKASCFKVLLALLTKSAPKEFEVPATTGNFYTNATQKTPNGLADIHDLVQRKIVDQFFAISELMHEDAFSKDASSDGCKFGKYEVKVGFPSMRLGALEVMFEAIKELEDLTEPLSKLPPFLWKLMIQWFFDYPHNSVYHSIFYKFVVTVIKSNDVPTLKNLFTKTKFLTRMIEHYADTKNLGCRGYILLICNVLRLTADSQKPSEYVPTMLSSHHTWKDFESKLRGDTMSQVELTVEDDPTFQRPLPHVGPLSITQESDDMVAFLARILKPGDIDLGSQFAYSLGFVGNYPDDEDELSDGGGEEESKKRKKNRKKREKRKSSVQRARMLGNGSSPGGVGTPIPSSPIALEPDSRIPRYQPPPTYSV